MSNNTTVIDLEVIVNCLQDLFILQAGDKDLWVEMSY